MESARLWVRHTGLKAKLKKDEWAKKDKDGNDKKPRLIVDFGVAASLQGFMVTSMLKKAMAGTLFRYRGFTFEFCAKPEPKSLESVFRQLLNPPGRGYFVYFSDDSCFSCRLNGKVHIANVDISSCDASHGPCVFAALKALTPNIARPDIQVLIDQNKLPLRVTSYTNRKNKVVLTGHTERLYSGSTITTVMNNTACYAIGVCLADHVIDIGTLGDSLRDAPARAGYKVTLDTCDTMYDIQFLKHSPVWDTNHILRAMLNPGVLFRASGTSHGEVPSCKVPGQPKPDFETRCRQMQGALLHGMYPRCSFELLNLMKRHTHVPSPDCQLAVNRRLAYKLSDSGDHFQVAPSEVWARYKATADEVLMLHEGLGNCEYGQSWAGPLADRVLHTDYGLYCSTSGGRPG
jgi:hypothetical protein